MWVSIIPLPRIFLLYSYKVGAENEDGLNYGIAIANNKAASFRYLTTAFELQKLQVQVLVVSRKILN